MPKSFKISTPVPLQPQWVDTVPPAPHPAANQPASFKTGVNPLISSRSCMTLGVCQERTPPCMDCDHDRGWRGQGDALQASSRLQQYRSEAARQAQHKPHSAVAGALVWLACMSVVAAIFISAMKAMA